MNSVFPNWKVKTLIGSGSYGKVYELERAEHDVVYRSAMKTIVIPHNDSEIKGRLAEGESQESVEAYYKDVTISLLNEIRMMADFKGNSNIVSYEDHQVVKHEDGIGCDIFIRMELLTPFIDYMAANRVTEDTVIQLGIDICKALEICERKNIIHRDIKPGNIFLSDTGDFKLGDFGIARTIDRTTGGLSKKGTYRYMAPEVYKGDPYGKTVDICSLGLVMYYLMNGNRTPFLPDAPAPVNYNDEESALLRRMRGEEIPPPKNAGSGLSSIILKACSFDPSGRYQSASEMRADLEALRTGSFRENATPYHRQTVGVGSNDDQTRGKKPIREVVATSASKAKGNIRTIPARKKTANRSFFVVVGGVLALMLVVACLVYFVGTDRNTENPIDNTIPEDAKLFEDPVDGTKHYFKIYNENATWSEAEAECEKAGGHLATITSEPEQNFLSNIIEQQGNRGDIYHYWLGGTDEVIEGEWKWVSGEPWSYTKWCVRQPNNGVNGDDVKGQDYLELQLTNGDQGQAEYMTWNDINNEGVSIVNGESHEGPPDYCSTKYFGYICEWDE